MAGEAPAVPEPLPLAGLRFCVPQTFVIEGLDETVGREFARALSTLSAAGARIAEIVFPEIARIPDENPHGGVLAAEAHAIHRKRIAAHGKDYDPRVRTRIGRGANLDAADYVDLARARARTIAEAASRSAPYDAILMPTVATVAPAIAPLDADGELYGTTNFLMLRNTSVGNYLDRCALSIPCHAPGGAPVGLMVMGETMGDRRLLAVGLAIEAALAR